MSRTSQYGDFDYREHFYQYTKYTNTKYPGDSFEGVTLDHFLTVGRDGRDGHSKNPIQLIPGTSTLWRHPSGYRRAECQTDRVLGTWTRTGPVDESVVEDIADIYSIDKNMYNPPMFDWSGPDIVWNDNLENRCIAEATQKFKSMDADLGQDLATLNQNLGMVTGLLQTLYKGCIAAKQGNLAGVINAIGDGRSAVRTGVDIALVYRFGWQPLMEDIYGVTKAIQQGLGTALILSSKQKRSESGHMIGLNGFENHGAAHMDCTVKLYGKVNDPYRRLGDKMGLSNPLSLGWDLVPYSFVVDWSLPVGSVLDTLLAPTGVDFLGGSCVQHVTSDAYIKHIAPSDWVENSPRITSGRAKGMRRVAYTDWPKAGLYVKPPVSISHIGTSITLLLQRLFR